jgi:hypothetical protein
MYVYSVLEENEYSGTSQRLVFDFEKAKEVAKQFLIEDMDIDISKKDENIKELLKYKKNEIKTFENKLLNAKEYFYFCYTGINEYKNECFYIIIKKVKIE